MIEDRLVLEFVGLQGKDQDVIRAQFPDFDMTRLVRAGLVELQSIELESVELADTQAHVTLPSIGWYVLTKRGAEAVGIDPDGLHAA